MDNQQGQYTTKSVTTSSVIIPRAEYECRIRHDEQLIIITRLLAAEPNNYVNVKAIRAILALDTLDDLEEYE